MAIEWRGPSRRARARREKVVSRGETTLSPLPQELIEETIAIRAKAGEKFRQLKIGLQVEIPHPHIDGKTVVVRITRLDSKKGYSVYFNLKNYQGREYSCKADQIIKIIS